MGQFRTSFDIKPAPFDINHQHSILSIGSCFANNMAERLKLRKFQMLQNPFGILYNPASIQNCLQKINDNHAFTSSEILKHRGQWHSWAHHSNHSKLSQKALLSHLQSSTKTAHSFLQKTNRIILTLGTAYVWINRTNGQVVANCHKLPKEHFERKRLGVQETIDALYPILHTLFSKNNQLRILLTISPIRHIRDGIIANQRSKAILQLAAEELCNQLDFVHYFPAYELLLDDLRDYRFYAKDMLHPNEVAIDYIWERFKQTYFTEKTKQTNSEIEKIIRASQHRPFQKETELHQQFLQQQLNQLQSLETRYPALDFATEKEIFAAQIS